MTLAALGLLVARRSPALAALAAYPYVIHKVAKRPIQPGFLSPMGLARLAVDVGGGALVDGVELSHPIQALLARVKAARAVPAGASPPRPSTPPAPTLAPAHHDQA